MSYTMASILVHSEHVPVAARDALRAARIGTPERRRELLESAARILHREAGVGCLDARELVGLQSEESEPQRPNAASLCG
jgi:hypothetical protein